MNAIGWIEGLEGAALVAVLSGLLFLEECGVPLPFAPGDLVLAVAGIAIAGGRVDAITLIAGVSIATVAGAVIGREIFALLGWSRLMGLADRLHARKPLEHAAGMLRRNGWRAVFTARLIPGLRVHTTEVAGASQMSRLSFLVGLLPATAVYVAGFVGLGVAFGRPVLRLIREAEHQVLLLLLAVFLVVLVVLLTRIGVRRTLQSLETAGWSGLRFRLDSGGLLLIPACIGLNYAGHAIADVLKLPLFLDSTGTILCAVLAGPWLGASVGVISTFINTGLADPNPAPLSFVLLAILESFALGFAAGLARYLNWQRQWSGRLSLWLVCVAIASAATTPINLLFSDGRTGLPLGDTVYSLVAGAHLPTVVASYLGEAAIDLPDKLVTVFGALLIAQGLPKPDASSSAVEVDLGEAFGFVVRSRNWRGKLAMAALCLLFSWVALVPLILLFGYTVAVARHARDGRPELPAWDQLRLKLADGFLMGLVFVIWLIPSTLLTRLGGGVLPALGSLLGLLILLAQPAIWSQYLEGGFRAAFNVIAIPRRLVVNPGLTMVVGAALIMLLGAALIGLVGFVIGVLLTIPYASWVGAYLVGKYASLTDRTRLEKRLLTQVSVD